MEDKLGRDNLRLHETSPVDFLRQSIAAPHNIPPLIFQGCHALSPIQLQMLLLLYLCNISKAIEVEEFNLFLLPAVRQQIGLPCHKE